MCELVIARFLGRLLATKVAPTEALALRRGFRPEALALRRCLLPDVASS
jgi:hypothetical protein